MKILIVIPRLLYPQDTGGKIRSSKIFEQLARDHEITILSLRYPGETDEQVERMRACCRHIEVFDWHETPKFSAGFFVELGKSMLWSTRPYIVDKYRAPALERRVRELCAAGGHDLLVCDFLQASANAIDVPFTKVLFQHNVEAVIRRRQYEQQTNWAKKAVLYDQWRKLFRYEKDACGRFDHTIMVSDHDRETMARDYGLHDTSSIPTGVDVDYFRASGPAPRGRDLVFTGSMDWLPNEDGMEWFAREVMPRIRAEEPDVKLWVVGRNPSARVRRLAEQHACIEVTGTVDDVRPYIERSAVYVVPIRIGGGTRMKIFEAMAMDRAVVSTSTGAEGLPVTDGRDIVIADEPAAFAGSVIRLLRAPEERWRLGDAAGALVRARFTHGVAAHRFAEICKGVLARSAGQRE